MKWFDPLAFAPISRGDLVSLKPVQIIKLYALETLMLVTGPGSGICIFTKAPWVNRMDCGLETMGFPNSVFLKLWSLESGLSLTWHLVEVQILCPRPGLRDRGNLF